MSARRQTAGVTVHSESLRQPALAGGGRAHRPGERPPASRRASASSAGYRAPACPISAPGPAAVRDHALPADRPAPEPAWHWPLRAGRGHGASAASLRLSNY